MAEKIDRKQLKRPDEFQVVAGRAMEWVAARQKQVAIILGTVAVVALAAWALAAWRSSRENKGGAALSEALELQSRPVAGEAAAQPGQETFPTAEDREKAVIAALEKVRAGHSGTTAALTALAEKGFHELKGADAAGAERDLREFLGSAGKGHPLRPFAQDSLGYALEAQGKLEEARAEFEKLRDYDLAARADFQAARLALVQGKPDARSQLERVAQEYAKELDVVRDANLRLELAALPPFPAAGETQPTPVAPQKPAKKK